MESSSFIDQLVVPGDVILDLSTTADIILGDGLCQAGDFISVLKSGKLRLTEPNIYWVESSQNMHVPDDAAAGDNLLGVPVDTPPDHVPDAAAGDNLLGVPVDTKSNDIVDDDAEKSHSSPADGPHIPDHLMTEFFLDFPLHRMPHLYLLGERFSNLVQDPIFSKLRSRKAVFVMFNNQYNILENYDGFHSRLPMDFPSVFPSQFSEYRLGGSTFGLVFLRQVTLFCKERLIVLNPISRCFEYVPDPELSQPCRLTMGCGAGVIDENKVLYFRLTRYDPSQPCDSCTPNTCGGHVLEILDVVNCNWSKIENLELGVNMFQDMVGTFFNGSLYWIAFRDVSGRFCDNLIVSLDCKERVFKFLYLPNRKRIPVYDDHLGVIGGDLCFVTIDLSNTADVVRIEGDDFTYLWSVALPDGHIKFITLTHDGGLYLHHRDLGIIRSDQKNWKLHEFSYDILDFKYTEDETESLSSIEFDQTFHFSLNFARGRESEGGGT